LAIATIAVDLDMTLKGNMKKILFHNTLTFAALVFSLSCTVYENDDAKFFKANVEDIVSASENIAFNLHDYELINSTDCSPHMSIVQVGLELDLSPSTTIELALIKSHKNEQLYCLVKTTSAGQSLSQYLICSIESIEPCTLIQK